MAEDDRVSIIFEGHVTTGQQVAANLVSKAGYVEQFRNRLGYEPFPGTLNIELPEDAEADRSSINKLDPIPIDEWSKNGQTFGPATCYPSKLTTEEASYTDCHVIVPDRTVHDPGVIEVIAPHRLRSALDLEDGTPVEVEAY